MASHDNINNFSYEQVQQFCSENEEIYINELSLLKSKFKKHSTVNDNVKIYAIKHRIKSVDSLYLKTKKDKDRITKLDDVTDFAGMRILCLFEDTVLRIAKNVDKIIGSDHKIIGWKVFNWPEVISKTGNDKYDLKYKASGYKSIHYIVENKASHHKVEIQLRTLFQDVWGELEHNFVYKKGNINQQIADSFKLLSKELSVNDEHVNILNRVRERHDALDKLDLKRMKPYSYFINDKPSEEVVGEELFNMIMDYESARFEEVRSGINTSEARKSLKTINRKILHKKAECDGDIPELDYWYNSEDAFLLFYEGKTFEAEKKYQAILDDPNHINKFVPHFRRGEIFFMEGDVNKAFKEFDKCDTKLDGGQPGNVFKVKVKQANIYWRLGPDYCKLALEKMEDAKKHLDYDNVLQYAKWLNSTCYYALENYLVISEELQRDEKARAACAGITCNETKKEEMDKKIKKKQEEVTESIKKANMYGVELLRVTDKLNPDIINIYDTAAWFCYQKYKWDPENNKASLCFDARKYLDIMDSKRDTMKNYTTNVYLSNNIHRAHYLEIDEEIKLVCEAEKKGSL